MSAPPPRLGPAALGSLLHRNADFRRLFLSSVVSFGGDWFAFVAVSGFVTESTGRAGSPAWVYAASVLPTFLFSPLAGVAADRLDRRKLMVAVDLLRIPPALGLCVALWLSSPALALVCVATLAALAAFFEPLASAVAPNLVDAQDLPLAQSALSAVWGSMLFFGAAVGGLVSATLGRQTSFVLNAATFGVSAWLVFRIRRPLQERLVSHGPGVAAQLREVFALGRAQLVTRTLLSTKIGVGLANGLVGLLPAFVQARFAGGDHGVGLLLAMRGLGALCGSFAGQAVVRGRGRPLFLLCGLSILTYAVAYAALPAAPSLTVAALCVALAHLGGGAQWALSTYGLQVTTPDALRGRVMTADFGLATLAIGVSSLGAGAGAEWAGLERACWTLCGVAFLYGLVFLLWTRRLWGGPGDPLRGPPAKDCGDPGRSSFAPRVGSEG